MLVTPDALPNVDQIRSLPHYWSAEPGSNSGSGQRVTQRYVATIDLAVPEFELWSIYIPEVLHDAEISLNGNPIGAALKPPLFSRAGLRTKYIPLPGGALKTGINTLALTVTAKPARKAMLGKLYIGPASTLAPWHEARVFQHQLLWFMVVALVLLSMISVVLGRSSRGDSVYFWFAAMCITWMLSVASQLLTRSILDWQWVELLGALSSIAFICIACLFCLSFVGQSQRLFTIIIIAASVVASVVYLASSVFALPGQLHLQITITILQSSGLYVGYCCLRQTLINPNDDIFLVTVTGSLVLVFGVYDTYMDFGSTSPTLKYANYLTPVLFAVAGFVLLRRFSGSLIHFQSQAAALSKPEIDHSGINPPLTLVEERERIMRDMHDGVGGHLVSSLSILRNHNINDPALEEALGQALVDLRLVIDSLEETDGDMSVAVAMLKERTQRALKDSPTQTTWHIDELVLPARGPADTLQILRIIQESIANALKHANADKLLVSARMADTELAHFCIEDNGQGFDSTATNPGRGLPNLHRRAQALDAKLEITSSQAGTRVDLWVASDSQNPRLPL